MAADHQPIEKIGDVTVTVTDKKLGRSQFYCGRCVYICVCVNIYIHQQGLMLEPHSKNNAFNVSPSSNVIVWGVNLKFSQLQVWDLTIRKPCSYKLVYNPIHLYIYYISAKIPTVSLVKETSFPYKTHQSQLVLLHS